MRADALEAALDEDTRLTVTKLESAENFSINRDAIQQLDLYTQEVAILGKSLHRAIGETDSRLFDRAEMTVDYTEEIATIDIYVKSRLLDLELVFDIHTDWA